MTSERIRCCVPFCQRTVRSHRAVREVSDVTEVICAQHWRAAQPELRRRYRAEQTRLCVLVRKDAATLRPETRAAVIRDWAWLGVMWGEIKKQAIEKAMGI